MVSILLIEPNTLLAATYQQMLQDAGYMVTHRPDAQTAIMAADETPPAMVILELQLPQHTGLEFLHEFRSYTEWRHIPVVVNTVLHPSRLAFGKEALRRDLGVGVVLYKPQTSLQDLLLAVRSQLAAI